jgi:epsilon-lactone hydrolase
MASSESIAVRDMYLSWTAARIKGEQQDPESWGNLTAEPRAVDYLKFELDGLRAMWALPARRDDDSALLWFHGGGFIAGSIYTHRKLCGHLAKDVLCQPPWWGSGWRLAVKRFALGPCGPPVG